MPSEGYIVIIIHSKKLSSLQSVNFVALLGVGSFSGFPKIPPKTAKFRLQKFFSSVRWRGAMFSGISFVANEILPKIVFLSRSVVFGLNPPRS